MKYQGKANIEAFLDFLQLRDIKMSPCSAAEIAILQKMTAGKCPLDYLTFMKWAGNGIRFLDGSTFTSNELPLLKPAANDLLEENNISQKLTEQDFVFLMHQGYQFYYFQFDKAGIYYFGEGENLSACIKVSASFTEFLIDWYNEVEGYL